MGSDIDSKFGGPLHCGYGTGAQITAPFNPSSSADRWQIALNWRQSESGSLPFRRRTERSENLKSGIGCALDARCGSLTRVAEGKKNEAASDGGRNRTPPFKHLAPPVDVNGSIDFCHSHVVFASLADLSLSNKIGHSCWFGWIIQINLLI